MDNLRRLALLVALVWAESIALGEDVAAERPTSSARTVEEIVVTAQKKEERLQDVPISVTAVEGETLRAADIDGFHELAELAPNVHATTDACCSTVYVRGFGSPFSPSAFEPSVGFAIDELAIPRGEYVSDPLYDLDRVEILRGPQGALFGKNTTAGLFHVVTAAPTRDFTGYALGRVGGLGIHRAEAGIGDRSCPSESSRSFASRSSISNKPATSRTPSSTSASRRLGNAPGV